MKTGKVGKLLRIYFGESDRINGIPLYEAIVLKAKEMGLSGSTVIRGVQGFGAHSVVIHKAKILRLSDDLPILVEIVDTQEKIKEAIEAFDKMIDESGCGVLMTMEQVEIIRYHH
jgi:PII-like signaling protein